MTAPKPDAMAAKLVEHRGPAMTDAAREAQEQIELIANAIQNSTDPRINSNPINSLRRYIRALEAEVARLKHVVVCGGHEGE